MNLRCRQCHETVWVQPDGSSQTAEASCRGCGQHYEWKAWGRLRGSGDQLGDDARKLALQKAIDLPGAYSVLLGVMSLEEVREFAGGPASTPAFSAGGKGRYDPAFAEAVAKGYLTSRQAMERGRREVYAAKLSQRRGLTPDLACAVADNRMSLLEALRESKTEAGSYGSVQISPPETRGVMRRRMLTAGVVIGLVVAAFLALRSPTEETRSTRRVSNLGDAMIATDERGRVLRVAAPNPRSVLRAYCSTGGTEHPLEEISIVPAATPGGRARLGLLRRPSEPEDLLSILIEEDREGGQWFVGDGTTLVVPEKAPDGARRQVPSPGAVIEPAGKSDG